MLLGCIQLGRAGPSFFIPSKNEDKEEASRELLEALKILEEQGLGDKKFFGGSEIGLVDISFGNLGLWFECMQELVGVTLLEPAKLPRLYTWVKNLQQHSVIKENLPDKNKLMGHMKQVREMGMRG
ncbi:hypothetical protein LIER_31253 [Lithospermum erythrorhizon]|uniref:GST C-terminal domain-containing protein n=1 Tax=Lithospermum erythrorhizon TaxID=34254 RepID=A0AAV3RQB1_LITER